MVNNCNYLQIRLAETIKKARKNRNVYLKHAFHRRSGFGVNFVKQELLKTPAWLKEVPSVPVNVWNRLNLQDIIDVDGENFTSRDDFVGWTVLWRLRSINMRYVRRVCHVSIFRQNKSDFKEILTVTVLSVGLWNIHFQNNLREVLNTIIFLSLFPLQKFALHSLQQLLRDHPPPQEGSTATLGVYFVDQDSNAANIKWFTTTSPSS